MAAVALQRGKAGQFVPVDPQDPRRQLLVGEELFHIGKSASYSFNTVCKDAPSLDKFEDAVQRFYEWYPCLKLTGERLPNGRYHLTEGNIRSPTFVEDIKNNPVIHSMDDFYDIYGQTYSDFFSGRYTYCPRMYKVDIPTTSANISTSFLNDKVGYVTILPSEHLIVDGKSIKVYHNVVNGFLNDRNYKPPISGPQIAPNNMGALVPVGAQPKPVKTLPYGPVEAIGFEKNTKVDKYKRGLSMNTRRIPASALGHPKKYTLTQSMSAVAGFLYSSLLMDLHKDAQKIGTNVTCPYTVDYKDFKPIMEGDHDYMIGNDFGTSRIYLTTDRASPKTLYEMEEISEKYINNFRSNLTQLLINERYAPYFPENIPPRKEHLSNLVTNMGKLKFNDGPISASSMFTLATYAIGCVEISTTGQNDGSIIFTAVSHKTSFPREFLDVYADLFIKLCKISKTRDITREELITFPEYKKLLSLIPE